ncbi:HARB1-like protein [Mya arenaria]|uniref:HARB1-like protein n=1 Tax=Mya arenaria TaxID=6604 RepID=A0ABY7EY37_MYAAR|nr:HARB1-like protein [Mya arenaria]
MKLVEEKLQGQTEETSPNDQAVDSKSFLLETVKHMVVRSDNDVQECVKRMCLTIFEKEELKCCSLRVLSKEAFEDLVHGDRVELCEHIYYYFRLASCCCLRHCLASRSESFPKVINHILCTTFLEPWQYPGAVQWTLMLEVDKPDSTAGDEVVECGELGEVISAVSQEGERGLIVIVFCLCDEKIRLHFLFRWTLFSTGERVVAISDGPDRECVGRYRLTKDAILRLEAALNADLEPSTNRTMLPSARDEVLRTKVGFFRKCRIPNIIGAVDGTLVPILAPKDNGVAFICRNGYHSINVMAVCDHEMRFTDNVARWPGSQHDAAVCLHRSGGALQYTPTKYCKIVVACVKMAADINANTQRQEELGVGEGVHLNGLDYGTMIAHEPQFCQTMITLRSKGKDLKKQGK